LVIASSLRSTTQFKARGFGRALFFDLHSGSPFQIEH
jgi:hypothetical protein